MKATELRIGNYIERHNKVHGEKDIIQVDGGTPLLAFEGMTTLKFNPIPLSEEWLLKFGFIYNDFINGYILDFEDKTLLFMDNGLDLCLMNNESIDCKYVHQLQNLYFALTGEEITLKP